MQPQPEFNSYYNKKNSSSNNKSKTATTTNNSKQQQSEEAAIAPKLQQQQQQPNQHQTTSEQQQQQQQYSEKQSCSRILQTPTTAKQQQQQKESPRVIKSKQPLVNFRFYLDIRDHQLTKYIEKQIQLLGGIQEFFLDANITHFVTDKEELPVNVLNINSNNNNNNNQPVTPTTPVTPQTPSNKLEFKNAGTSNKCNTYKVGQTRANAILSRVRVQNNSPTVAVSSPIRQITTTTTTAAVPNYTIWQSEYAVRFFKKVQHELKAYLQPENKISINPKQKSGAISSGSGSVSGCATDIITLKGGFIKFEAIKRSCRPYYHSFRAPYFDWPKISLKSEEGAFSCKAKKPIEMTRKSRSRSSQCATPLEVTIPPLRKTITNTPIASTATGPTGNNRIQCPEIKDSTDKQCGVCEICKVEYDTLTIHLKTKDHEYFARNTQNFIALDTLIQSSADVNKFLSEEVENNTAEQMEVEIEEDVQESVDPLEQPLAVNNLSPPLREKSKRSTKGKHSSEKFQNKRMKSAKATTKTTTTTKTPPKTLQITPTKNNNSNNSNNNSSMTTTRRKRQANSSSPIRPFPPPSSLYKVVETSQVETTPRRSAAGRMNENVTASPSLIVKIKKVRTSALLRLNGEAESFMFPKTPRRASSDLPTDVDRQSSSERVRTSIYSSSSLDSSSISDIVVNLETPEPNKTKGTQQKTRKKAQCFQSAPIQPNEQLKRLRKSNKTTTTTTSTTPMATTKTKHETTTDIADLSPPSAAAAIVAATAKITLPAATRKSSRMATAIVSAATTSSRLLRAAAEVVKKSGRTNARKSEIKQEALEIQNSSRSRRCRLAADLAVVKMEDRMGDSSEVNSDNDACMSKVARTRSMNPKRKITTRKSTIEDDNDDDDDDDQDDDDDEYDDVNDDDKDDKDYKYKLKKSTIKPRSRRGKRKKSQIKSKASAEKTTAQKKSTKNNNSNESSDSTDKKETNKSQPHFDFTKSERIQEQKYAFERVPEADLWYRVFKRQDNFEEAYFQYFASTKYHKLPYEMGPIPYTHTKLSTNCCKLCEPIKQEQEQEQEQEAEQVAEEQPTIKTEETTAAAEKPTDSATPYALKHKKLHLLQRYRQEQEALLQEKLKEKQQHCYIKAENLSSEVSNSLQSDLEHCERAGSTQSTSSSCASTNTLQQAKKCAFRNKLLQKAALSSLELPPRKSPREHASTLALVSIIKQRQESKPNSDAEEVAPSVPTTPIPKEEPSNTNTPIATVTRSAAATPVEEMCFATEISENVKRMRRGRNKYDHSPPYVVNNSKRLIRQKLNKTTTPTKSEREKICETEIKSEAKASEVLDKRLPKPRRSYDFATVKYKPRKSTTQVNMLHSKNLNLPPSVRKTGQKKGVLEFSVDESALKALDAALQPEVNVRKLEFEIDNFLTNTGKELDVDCDLLFEDLPAETKTEEQEEKVTECLYNTPPATDYFSSDFDLCDLLQDAHNSILIGEEAQKRCRETKHLSVYNTMALKKYFRKRKYMKSNRTGWPKLQKKKYSMRHQTLIANELKKQSAAAAKAIITPPDSEGDAVNMKKQQENIEEKPAELEIDTEAQEIKRDESDEEMFYDGAESLPEEEDTVLDSIVNDEELAEGETEHFEEYEKAVEADDEDEFNDALDVDQDENTIADKEIVDSKQAEHIACEVEEGTEKETPVKSSRRNSSLGMAFANCLNNNDDEKEADDEDIDMLSLMATTSTPSTNLARSSRRTPQLNGSLISCHSPLERAGDNSDIFTVSSDGLDTDLDLSNPHAQPKEESQPQTHKVNCNSRNRKTTKYDITKYVKNPAANTCAAEAATAAVKSLAIAQFLKKEVRVTCRRIRAPFRRFRYRR